MSEWVVVVGGDECINLRVAVISHLSLFILIEANGWGRVRYGS